MNAIEFLEIINVNNMPITDSIKFAMADISPNQELRRKNAAVLTHLFIRDVLHVSDITEKEKLDEATKLKDIYDCRVCTQHIIQVYARGIMDAWFVIEHSTGECLVFGGEEEITQNEAQNISERTMKLSAI